MRITGGYLKGRIIDTPNGKMAIRPAMDRMRESIFDILGNQLEGKSFLDLFSGSGTIAIEAVSHGAKDVTLCEMDRAKAKTVLQNVSITEKEMNVKIDCHFTPVELFIKRCKKTFDYIFFDPPFPYKYRLELLSNTAKKKLLNPGGKIMIHYPQEDKLPEEIEGLKLVDKRIFGRSIVNFYTWKDNNKEGEG